MTPHVKRVADAYVYSWGSPDFVEIEVEHVRHSSDDWVAWMTVRTRAPGMSPHLVEGRQTLGSVQSRTALARHLKTLMPEVDWGGYLEMACVLTVRSEREGDAFQVVGSLEDPVTPIWALHPIVMHGPTIWYGDGGTAKSYAGLLFASIFQSGQKVVGVNGAYEGGARALYLDWETDADEINARLRQLRVGHNTQFPDLAYRRETWPLAQIARQVKRYIDEQDIRFVVIDSIGMACGGDPEKADVVLAFFQAVRSLGVPAFCIDHIRKNEHDGKPFGSAYKWNAARLAFEVRKVADEETGDIHIGVYHRKANNARLLAPFGLGLTFREGSARFSREEIQEPTLAKGLSQLGQVKAAMANAGKAIYVVDIVAATGLQENTVRARLADLVKRQQAVTLITHGTQEAARYALVTAREEAG